MTSQYGMFLLTLEIIKKVSEGGDFDYHYEPRNLSITLNGKTYRQGDYAHPIYMRNEMMED